MFAGETALCFFLIDDNAGTTSLITDPEQFPLFCTEPYLKRAIETCADCLGAFHRGFSKKETQKKWLKFDSFRRELNGNV